MTRRILLAGALGTIALFLWTFIANVVFGFTARFEMNRVANEHVVYEILRDNVVAPGAYVVNPAPTASGGFPAGPVFAVTYGGVGHEAAGRMFIVETALALVTVLLVTGLLAASAPSVLARYLRRALFVTGIGVLLAVTGDLGRIGIAGLPIKAAVLLAANTVLSWTAAGLAVAWVMRPRHPWHAPSSDGVAGAA